MNIIIGFAIIVVFSIVLLAFLIGYLIGMKHFDKKLNAADPLEALNYFKENYQPNL
ncbi:MAG: hypothetical protein J0H76_05290 [Sphingobacteriales bacterium]|nr:hypothetical protein [Sphingobacteriales bacterium]